MKVNVYRPYLDITKFILSCLVVFIHFVLPKQLGGITDCIARVAVPFFFMISGYYAYKCNNKDLWRRLLRNLIYLVGATAVYLLWGIWKTYHLSDSTIGSYLHDNFNRSTIRDFLFYGVNTFSTPLWFIEALVVAYFVFIVVSKMIKHDGVRAGVFGILIFVLLGWHFWKGLIKPIVFNETITNHYYRNAWFFGIPMFLVGYEIRFWKERSVSIKCWYRFLQLCLIVVGIALGLYQWFRFGKAEIPIGMLIVAISLFLFVLDLPAESDNKKLIGVTKILGQASLWIYLFHKLVGDIIQSYAPYNSVCRILFENDYLFPVVVMVISSGLSFIFVCIVRRVKNNVITSR